MTEYMNRMRYAFQRALNGDLDSLDVAELFATKGFKHHLFNEVEEVRIAAQAIIIKADLDVGVGLCHGECGINRVCAVNALIDRKVDEGQISAKLGELAKFRVRYEAAADCRLAKPHREVEVASYNPPRFLDEGS